MRAVLRGVLSPDVDDLASFSPSPDDPWSVFVQLLVGPDRGDGEESFDLTVCNGRWLDARASETGVLLVRHHLVMPVFDWHTVAGFVESFLSGCRGETWPAVALSVSRLGFWEFEDYRP